MNLSAKQSRAKSRQTDPFVSVIVPVYNVERYIDDCMLSVRMQDYDNLEIIVVNDGSTDGSAERVRAHATIDRRIRIIEQQNIGLGGARNTGLTRASGEFVMFVDGDDFVSTQCLRTLLEAQGRGNYDIVSGKHIKISDANEFVEYQRDQHVPDVTPPLSECELVLGRYDYSVVWARVFKRRLLISAGVKFPERFPHEDLFFTYKILRHYPHHGRIDDYIYFWRQRVHSLSRSLTEAHLGIPSHLRRDTYEFLQSVRATQREYVLAARRNISLLNSFRKRAERGEAALFDSFVELLQNERSEILADLERLDGGGIQLKLMVPPLRKMLGKG